MIYETLKNKRNMKQLLIQLIDTEEKKSLDQIVIIQGIERVTTKEHSGTEKRYIVLNDDFAQIENEATLIGKLIDIIDKFNNKPINK